MRKLPPICGASKFLNKQLIERSPRMCVRACARACARIFKHICEFICTAGIHLSIIAVLAHVTLSLVHSFPHRGGMRLSLPLYFCFFLYFSLSLSLSLSLSHSPSLSIFLCLTPHPKENNLMYRKFRRSRLVIRPGYRRVRASVC